MKLMDKEKMWDCYRKTPTPELREKLIIEYAQLVKLVAGRLSMYLGHNVEFDDLVSYGIFGLIDAIDKFDTDKNVKFETYASLRITWCNIRSDQKNGLDSKNCKTKTAQNR